MTRLDELEIALSRTRAVVTHLGRSASGAHWFARAAIKFADDSGGRDEITYRAGGDTLDECLTRLVEALTAHYLRFEKET